MDILKKSTGNALTLRQSSQENELTAATQQGHLDAHSADKILVALEGSHSWCWDSQTSKWIQMVEYIPMMSRRQTEFSITNHV
jgi:hypothetical protein